MLDFVDGDQPAASNGKSRPSMRQRTTQRKTSRTVLSSGSSPSLTAAHAAASSAAASRTAAASILSPASIASESRRELFSRPWISFRKKPHELLRLLSLRFPSSASRSVMASSGGAHGYAAAARGGGGVGRWCSAAARSGHGTAATSAHAVRWSTQPMAYAAAAAPSCVLGGGVRLVPMACSCRAADHERDTPHESDRKWDEDEEEEEDEMEARAGEDFAELRPKERLRWGMELAAEELASARRAERSESALRARRSWPSWISFSPAAAEAAMPARRAQRRAWSTPSRAALQTSSSFTARSWNSAASLSACWAPRHRWA
ncbi:hypothetical protein BRADI_4g24735v3 [Brachypodium distachyon]|uniref:Uncharacterized protein n=1 Tax=Brachypodium distachyon TaxID=15368 RepID=A0A2K2CQ21_BRADI|nr:hypothetical protein BRADI_4g24735v3 [Brachypodium distachyon]